MNINATLLGQAIVFIMFVWFCMKFIWPPMLAAIEERQKNISEGLASAERSTKNLELAQAKASKLMQEAKRDAAEVIEQANKRKAQIIDEAREDALVERNKILEQGKAELETEQNRARSELRKQVADLAIIGAEKIIEREVDTKTHKDILENITAQL